MTGSLDGSKLQSLAAAVEGFDAEAVDVSQARQLILRRCESVIETEVCPIEDALERILAHDLMSPLDVPSHDNSAMDGYSLAASDLKPEGDSILRVVATAFAGRPCPTIPQTGEAVRIMTGAVMPQGHDTVVAQEVCRVEGDWVRIPFGQAPGQNRRLRAEDLRQGRPALTRGTRIGPAELGLIASLGLSSVEVRRRVRVAYFSTGDELRPVGEALSEGQIYDSNRYTLRGLLSRLDAELLDLGIVPDRPESLEHTIREASRRADLIISSAGVSVGEADYTREVLGRLGDIAFWTIAMRPGKPLAFGRVGPALYFGLPGNPVAVMVTFIFLVREALLKRAGAQSREMPVIRAGAMTPIRKRPGRTEYQRGRLVRKNDGEIGVQLSGNQGSGILSSMSEADCIIVMAPDQGHCAVGERLDCLPLSALLNP